MLAWSTDLVDRSKLASVSLVRTADELLGAAGPGLVLVLVDLTVPGYRRRRPGCAKYPTSAPG